MAIQASRNGKASGISADTSGVITLSLPRGRAVLRLEQSVVATGWLIQQRSGRLRHGEY
jgi:hypothetical protein